MSLSRILLLKSLLRQEKRILHRFYSQNRVDLGDPAVQEYLKGLFLEHEGLYTKSKKTREETQRLRDIKPVIAVLEERITLFDSIESLKEINNTENDSEMKKWIKEEAEIYLKRVNEVDNQLLASLTVPVFSEGGVLLEVTAGAGGQEAMLFARELLDMYLSYAGHKGWEANVASLEKSDLGGIRKGSLLISGYSVPELMKIEAGVHRVQRIPATEKAGRIHTSTVSVAVLPQATEIEIDIPPRDVVIETKRASGAGGQHVNTTDSAVRIVHTPTGTVVECQEGRSQIKNREIALQKLRALLYDKQVQAQSSEINNERKSQIGSSNRNEKVRTYNYPQDRVTEHREEGGTNYNLKKFMEGGTALNKLHQNLLTQYKHEQVLKEIDAFVQTQKSSQG